MDIFFTLHFKAVADPPYGFNVLGLRRIHLNLLPDLLDMNRNRRNIPDGLHVPDFREQLFLRIDMVGMSGDQTPLS